MGSSTLGDYKGMYTKIFTVHYIVMLLIEYYMINYRFYKDIFNKELAAFHIKEFLILKILVFLLELVDSYSLSTTLEKEVDPEITAKKDKGPPKYAYDLLEREATDFEMPTERISKETPGKVKLSRKERKLKVAKNLE